MNPRCSTHQTRDDSIRVLSWNLNGEAAVSTSQLLAQLAFLDAHCSDVDLFLFQAVRNQETTDEGLDPHLDHLLEYFEAQQEDYFVVHTADWARELQDSSVQPHADISNTHNRCHVTVSRWPIERQPLQLRNNGDRKPRKLHYYYSHFPEKMLVSEIDTSHTNAVTDDNLEVWNVGIVNGAYWGEEKVNMLETVYARIYLQNTKLGHPLILAGDFNAPMKETDDRDIIPHGGPAYTNYPFYGDPHYLQDESGERVDYEFGERWRRAEARLFNPALADWDMQDAYLASDDYEPSTEDYTHIIHNGTPAKKRLDHILVSSHFAVENCEIWNGRHGTPNGLKANGSYKSDHAPVVADVNTTPT